MIFISKELENNIKKESEKAYPNECCGVILGILDDTVGKKAMCIESIDNSREESEKYHRFLITPEDMMKSERKARSLKMDILGFYHSHPDHPAKPSDFDREHALPFYSYIITAVNQGTAGDFTSWELSEDRSIFNTEEIREE